MNRRGKRLTLGVMAVGLAVVLVLAIAHWGTVRDHVVAWHFQLTRETKTIEPDPRLQEIFAKGGGSFALKGCLLVLATLSGWTVVFDPAEDDLGMLRTSLDREGGGVTHDSTVTATAAPLLDVLQASGYRVLAQRFPRRAYVVIREEAQKPRETTSMKTGDFDF